MLIPRDASLGAVLLLILLQALVAFNLVVWNINTLTLRQVVTPRQVLGRMNASYRLVLYGVAPLGALLGGLLGETLGLREAMVTTALLMLVPIGWIFFSPVFRLTHMPDGADANDAAPNSPQKIPAPAQPAPQEEDRDGAAADEMPPARG